MDAEMDMRLRMLPTETSIRHAKALLDAEPLADVAVIPMYFPGKRRGWWEISQEVRTVPGVVFVAVNSFEASEHVPSASWARDTASNMAKEAMQVEGTTGWAYVWRDGHVSVTEDIL